MDPFNDRKTKIYASCGRFFEKVPLDIAVRSLSVETSLTGALYTDPGPGKQPNLSPSNYIPGGNIALPRVRRPTPSLLPVEPPRSSRMKSRAGRARVRS